jgi:hypothetical protein
MQVADDSSCGTECKVSTRCSSSDHVTSTAFRLACLAFIGPRCLTIEPFPLTNKYRVLLRPNCYGHWHKYATSKSPSLHVARVVHGLSQARTMSRLGRILLYMGPIMPLFVCSLTFYIFRPPLDSFLFFSCWTSPVPPPAAHLATVQWIFFILDTDIYHRRRQDNNCTRLPSLFLMPLLVWLVEHLSLSALDSHFENSLSRPST